MPVKILSRFNTIISNYKESAKTKTKTKNCQTDCEKKKIFVLSGFLSLVQYISILLLLIVQK